MSPVATAATLIRLSCEEIKKFINYVKHRNAIGTCIHHTVIVERENVACSGKFPIVLMYEVIITNYLILWAEALTDGVRKRHISETAA